jgi:hypothetical protein
MPEDCLEPRQNGSRIRRAHDPTCVQAWHQPLGDIIMVKDDVRVRVCATLMRSLNAVARHWLAHNVASARGQVLAGNLNIDLSVQDQADRNGRQGEKIAARPAVCRPVATLFDG